METKDDWRSELVHLVMLATNNQKLLNALLDDLLTPEEIKTIASRWQIIKKLQNGMPQREIAQSLGVSIATVTRGSRMLNNPKGGFRQMITMILSSKKPTGLTKTWQNQLTE